MTFPLYAHDVFGFPTGLVMAVLIGFGFGFALERGGFGRAPVLAAQFYFTDNRVFKVLFTAITTATVGLALLSGLGIIDLSMVTVPATFVWPQLLGGLLLGAGFIIAGYCPGTSVVSAASGNLDGLVTYGGVAVGTLVFGAAWPVVEGFYHSGALGAVRLDQALGVPFAVVALAVLNLAIIAFIGVEKLEATLAERGGTEPPDVHPGHRNRVLGGLSVATLGALLMVILPSPMTASEPTPARASKAFGHIGALALAKGLVADPSGYYVVDLRSPKACAKARVPGALCRPGDDPGVGFLATLPATRTLVLYAQADLDQLPRAATRFPGQVQVLDGGFAAFHQAILTAPEVPADPTPQAVEAYRLQSALHGKFTGTATAPPPVAVVPRAVKAPTLKKGGGC